MTLQFECPACGGMIDYPAIDKVIEEYDFDDKDEYYYEDVFEEELTVVCDWCKKRVEVPLDLPKGSPAGDPLKRPNSPDGSKAKIGSFQPWPNTIPGRVVIGVLFLIYIFSLVIVIYDIGW